MWRMDGWMEEEEDGSLNGLTIRAPNGANNNDDNNDDEDNA